MDPDHAWSYLVVEALLMVSRISPPFLRKLLIRIRQHLQHLLHAMNQTTTTVISKWRIVEYRLSFTKQADMNSSELHLHNEHHPA